MLHLDTYAEYKALFPAGKGACVFIRSVQAVWSPLPQSLLSAVLPLNDQPPFLVDASGPLRRRSRSRHTPSPSGRAQSTGRGTSSRQSKRRAEASSSRAMAPARRRLTGAGLPGTGLPALWASPPASRQRWRQGSARCPPPAIPAVRSEVGPRFGQDAADLFWALIVQVVDPLDGKLQPTELFHGTADRHRGADGSGLGIGGGHFRRSSTEQ